MTRFLPMAILASSVFACAAPSDEPSDHDPGEAPIAKVESALTTVNLTYRGSNGEDEPCTVIKNLKGFLPSGAGPYPVFLYFAGTGDPWDPQPVGNQQWAGYEVLQQAATAGYAAFAVEYDNNPITGGFTTLSMLNKTSCIFNPKSYDSAISVACRQAGVDCDSKGVYTWGHSQGAAVAGIGANYDPRVRAAWLTGFGWPFGSKPWVQTVSLPKDRFRLVNGKGDPSGSPTNNGSGSSNDVATLNEITGRSCAPGAANVSWSCLNGPNASGWYLVDKIDTVHNDQSHCWFYKPGCFGDQDPEPNWKNQPNTRAFSIQQNVSWLQQSTFTTAFTEPQRNADFYGWDKTLSSLPYALQREEYPAAFIRWRAANDQPSKFVVGAANGTTLPRPHVYIQPNGTDLTGEFSIFDPARRKLDKITVYNTGAATTLTVRGLSASGVVTQAPAGIPVPPGATEITLSFPYGTARVQLASTVGAALKFTNFYLTTQTVPVSTAVCPAANVALRSSQGKYVTVQSSGQLAATATSVGASETFACTDVTSPTRGLTLRNGTKWVGVGTGFDHNVTATSSTAAATFLPINFGKGYLALTYNGSYVSDIQFLGDVLHADQANLGDWERFTIVPR